MSSHEGTWRTLFITSYEIFDIYHVNDITELQIEFEDKTIGNLKLTPDWVKWLWKSPQDKLNVTVIEFSTTALKVLSTIEIRFTYLSNSHKSIRK